MVVSDRLHDPIDSKGAAETLHLAVDWQNRFLFSAQTAPSQSTQRLLQDLSTALRRFAAAGIGTLWVVTGARPECQRIKPQETASLCQRHDVPVELAALMRGWLLVKTRDSAFSQPQLLTSLRQRGIRRLLVSGFQAQHCIAATAREASVLGFECSLLSDLIGGADNAGAAQRHRQLCDTYGVSGASIGVQRLACLVPGIAPRRLFRGLAQPVAAAQALFRREQAALLA